MRRLVLASVLCLAVGPAASAQEAGWSLIKTGGFDAATTQYVDLVEAGIIDPTKVPAQALGWGA